MKWPLLTLRSFSIRGKKFLPFTSLSTASLPYQYRLIHLLQLTRIPIKSYTSQALHVVDRGLELSSDRDIGALDGLPWTCPGCGAYSQTHRVDDAGYYSLARNQVAAYISGEKTPLESRRSSEKRLLHKILADASQEVLQSARVLCLSADCKLERDEPAQDSSISNPII